MATVAFVGFKKCLWFSFFIC